jgi:invasion protein IalB
MLMSGAAGAVSPQEEVAMPQFRRFAPCLIAMLAMTSLPGSASAAASSQAQACADGAGTADCNNPEPGDWQLTERAASGDQPAALVVGTYSTEPVGDLFDGASPGWLSVTCAQNRTSVRLRLKGNVLSDIAGYGAVAVSFDGAPAQTLYLNSGETDDTLGLMIGAQAVQLVVQMMQSDAVLFEVTALNDRPRSVEFLLDGFGAAIQPLRRACNW